MTLDLNFLILSMHKLISSNRLVAQYYNHLRPYE